MNNNSFWEGVFLISGIAGFIFWPAWIVTGIALLMQSGHKPNSSHVSKKHIALRPTPHRPHDTAVLPLNSDAIQSENKSVLPDKKRVDAAKRTQNRIGDTQSNMIALPEVADAKRAIRAGRNASHAIPETTPTRPKSFPVGTISNLRIAQMVEERRIEQLIHFTRCENLGMILNRGLLSVTDLEMERIHAMRNDPLRLDAKPGAICLSVSFPNYRMFYKYRCEVQDAEWAVLRLKPAILWELDCLFYEMNAADHRMRYRSKPETQGPNSFASLFGDVGGARPSKLHPSYPTNLQAEVLVMEPIDPCYIQSVAFETQQSHSRWAHLTGNTNVAIEGRGTGLFGSRERVVTH